MPFVISETRIKATVHPPELLRLKRLAISGVDEDVKYGELVYTTDGSLN